MSQTLVDHSSQCTEQPTATQTDVGSVFKVISLWFARAQQRRQLARLSDDLLEDIGVSRAAAIKESRKPFWKD